MSRSTFKVLFYVNGSKEKDGIVPIMGRVTINGTVSQFSCKQSIPKTLWDVKGNKAKGKGLEAREINLVLDNIKAQIIKHYQRISDREAFVTAEMVRNAYQGIGSEYETLIKAFDKDCANFLKRVGKDRTIGTYKVMMRARNYVAAFIKSFYKRNDMSMLELTPDFIKEFAAYLTAERNLKNATIWLNCMWLKGVVMRAHYNGLIPRNPFAQFHISPNVKEREYLTEDEIKTIMSHEFKSPTLALVRDLFVFACFTALSFVDMKELTTDEIVIIYDDISMPVGQVRIRPKGSAGGHNGIKSIIAHLGTQEFPRIKIGVGAKPENGDLVKHVLGRFSKEDDAKIRDVFALAEEGLLAILQEDVKTAMNAVNGKKVGE